MVKSKAAIRNMGQYFVVLINNGIEDLDTIKLITMETLMGIGIDKIGHQMKLMNCIKKLNEKGQSEGNTSYVQLL